MLRIPDFKLSGIFKNEKVFFWWGVNIGAIIPKNCLYCPYNAKTDDVEFATKMIFFGVSQDFDFVTG